MTVRAPKRRDHVAVVSALPILGRRLLAAVCARPHPEDVSEACSATLLVPVV